MKNEGIMGKQYAYPLFLNKGFNKSSQKVKQTWVLEFKKYGF